MLLPELMRAGMEDAQVAIPVAGCESTPPSPVWVGCSGDGGGAVFTRFFGAATARAHIATSPGWSGVGRGREAPPSRCLSRSSSAGCSRDSSRSRSARSSSGARASKRRSEAAREPSRTKSFLRWPNSYFNSSLPPANGSWDHEHERGEAMSMCQEGRRGGEARSRMRVTRDVPMKARRPALCL